MNKRPVTVVCMLAIFWAKIGFGTNSIVRTPKFRCDDQTAKRFLKRMIPRRLTVFCKLVNISLVMGVKKNLKKRVAKSWFDQRHQKTW